MPGCFCRFRCPHPDSLFERRDRARQCRATRARAARLRRRARDVDLSRSTRAQSMRDGVCLPRARPRHSRAFGISGACCVCLSIERHHSNRDISIQPFEIKGGVVRCNWRGGVASHKLFPPPPARGAAAPPPRSRPQRHPRSSSFPTTTPTTSPHIWSEAAQRLSCRAAERQGASGSVARPLAKYFGIPSPPNLTYSNSSDVVWQAA